MSLHAAIMNIQSGKLPDVEGTSHANAYSMGHRDARRDIDPAEWAKHADGCLVCRRYRRLRGVTRWMDGRTKPSRVGWYERLFTDGVYRQFWDGYAWCAEPGGVRHWRQVGDYPAWRGLTCTAFISPSRYKVARAPNV